MLAVLFAACGGAAPTTTPATATTGGDPAVELLMTLIVADADPQLEYDRGGLGLRLVSRLRLRLCRCR